MKFRVTVFLSLFSTILCAQGITPTVHADIFSEVNQDEKVFYFAYAETDHTLTIDNRNHVGEKELTASLNEADLDMYFGDVLKNVDKKNPDHQAFVSAMATR